jgi:hypothetical protein
MPSLALLLPHLLSTLSVAWAKKTAAGGDKGDPPKPAAAAGAAAGSADGPAAGSPSGAGAAADDASASPTTTAAAAVAAKPKAAATEADLDVESVCESLLLVLAVPQTVALVSADGEVQHTSVKRVTEFLGVVLGHPVVQQSPAMVSRLFGELAAVVRGLLARREAFPSFLMSAMVGQLFEQVNAGLLDVKPEICACWEWGIPCCCRSAPPPLIARQPRVDVAMCLCACVSMPALFAYVCVGLNL